MRHSLTIVAVCGGLAAGCGGTPERTFIEEYEPLFCQGYSLCASQEMLRTINARECLQHLRQQEYPQPPDCLYDPEIAEACIAGLQTAGCEANDPEVPEECERVYGGCRLPRVPPEEGLQRR